MDEQAELDNFRRFVISAFRYSKVPRGDGQDYKTISARCLGITRSEVERLLRRGTPASRANKRAYRQIQFALLERGHMLDIPPLVELVTGIDFPAWCDWMTRDPQRCKELVQLWNVIQRNKMH